jgi:FtsP/CotA-like multicopper oxidase with cupredoxin domain
MRARHSMSMRWGIAGKVGLGLLAAGLLAQARPASAQAIPPEGIACTNGSLDAATNTRTFQLATGTGYIVLPDGSTAFMWGYAPAGGAFQHPGPVLCANQGETVVVVLQNTLPRDDASIVFPGQENVLANGALAQPQFNASGALQSLAPAAAANGGGVTYSFVASRPGTFVYESGTAPWKQVRLGLFGALLVRPTLGAGYAYNRADSQFDPGDEFMVLLSEIDPYQHRAAELNKPFNLTTYHPRYWLVNGRGFPDSIADNGASWLPAQPYGALARIQPKPPGTLPGMIRYLNVGTEDFPFHPHGNNGLVIGRDGNPLAGPGGQDLSFEKFAINIGPGQTWDVVFRWWDAEGYTPANFPVTIPSLANVTLGMFYSGSPFLGGTAVLPPGVVTQNQCGEYWIISHNHALYQITSWGVNMTGPITYLRIDPPLPNNCQ